MTIRTEFMDSFQKWRGIDSLEGGDTTTDWYTSPWVFSRTDERDGAGSTWNNLVDENGLIVGGHERLIEMLPPLSTVNGLTYFHNYEVTLADSTVIPDQGRWGCSVGFKITPTLNGDELFPAGYNNRLFSIRFDSWGELDNNPNAAVFGNKSSATLNVVSRQDENEALIGFYWTQDEYEIQEIRYESDVGFNNVNIVGPIVGFGDRIYTLISQSVPNRVSAIDGKWSFSAFPEALIENLDEGIDDQCLSATRTDVQFYLLMDTISGTRTVRRYEVGNFTWDDSISVPNNCNGIMYEPRLDVFYLLFNHAGNDEIKVYDNTLTTEVSSFFLLGTDSGTVQDICAAYGEADGSYFRILLDNKIENRYVHVQGGSKIAGAAPAVDARDYLSITLDQAGTGIWDDGMWIWTTGTIASVEGSTFAGHRVMHWGEPMMREYINDAGEEKASLTIGWDGQEHNVELFFAPKERGGDPTGWMEVYLDDAQAYSVFNFNRQVRNIAPTVDPLDQPRGFRGVALAMSDILPNDCARIRDFYVKSSDASTDDLPAARLADWNIHVVEATDVGGDFFTVGNLPIDIVNKPFSDAKQDTYFAADDTSDELRFIFANAPTITGTVDSVQANIEWNRDDLDATRSLNADDHSYTMAIGISTDLATDTQYNQADTGFTNGGEINNAVSFGDSQTTAAAVRVWETNPTTGVAWTSMELEDISIYMTMYTPNPFDPYPY